MNTLTISQNGDANTGFTINLDHPGALLPLLILEEMHAHRPIHDPIRALLNALMYVQPVTIVDSTDTDPACGYSSIETVQRNGDGSLETYGSLPRDTEDDPDFKPAWDAHRARRQIKSTLHRRAIQKLTILTDDLRAAIEENCGCVTESVRAEYESKALPLLYVLHRFSQIGWTDLKKLILGYSQHA